VSAAGPIAPRADFPLLAAQPALRYLDSAATSQKPRVVLDAMRRYYETENANPHRGAYALAAAATVAYARARETIARFLGADDAETLVFTRGTTESINLLAAAWGRANVCAGDRIVVTRLEHHANFVPWQQLAIEQGAEFRICELTPDGEVDLDQLRALATPNTKVVAFGHVSNAIGTINAVPDIAAIAHRVGAIAVCDGAQGAPHMRVEFDRLGVDAYAFSGHKMFGPTGIGVLWARRELLEAMPPHQGGGDMILSVSFERSTYNEVPYRFEAGTPHIAGAIGLAAAARYMDSVGLDRIATYEGELLAYATRALSAIPEVTLVGTAPVKASVLSFVMGKGIHPHDIGSILDQEGIAIRAGFHCAQPVVERLGHAATARASLAFYNTRTEVDRLVAGLAKVLEIFG